MNKRNKRITWLGLALLVVWGSWRYWLYQPAPVQHQFVVFGTQVSLTLYDTPAQEAQTAIRQIEQRFYQFHQDWHAWEKGGIVSKINQAIAQQTPITVSADIKAFIEKSQRLAQQSNNLFDPGIGQLIRLWGFHSEDWHGPPPSEQAIQNWLATRPSIQDIQFNQLTLTCSNPNVSLDFGGNAKGLALDIAMTTLQQAGIKNAVVNIGGDLRVMGSKHGQPWRVGVQNPLDKNADSPLGYLELMGAESLVTSGSYQRYFEWQGKRYSHIINPNTGYPADHFISVTVLHPDATTADAAATALMIAGQENWQTLAKQMGIEYALMISETGARYMTKKMENRFKML